MIRPLEGRGGGFAPHWCVGSIVAERRHFCLAGFAAIWGYWGLWEWGG